MFGNRPILEPHSKIVARTRLRATFFGYTVLDMIILLLFLSLFTLTIPQIKVSETSEIERLYTIKKVIDTHDYVCQNNVVVIEGESLDNVSCKVFLTYVRFYYKGYYFYADKRI